MRSLACVHCCAVLLLKQPGINIHAASNSKATPLHEAAAAGNIPLLQLLLQHGAQPQDITPGFSILHAACMGSCLRPSAPAHAPAAAPAQPAVQDPVLQDPQHMDSKCAEQDPIHEQQQGQHAAVGSLAVTSKPGQLRTAATSSTQSMQQLRPKPPTAAAPKKAGTAAPQRPTAGSRTAAAPARPAVPSTVRSTANKAAPPAGTGTAAAGALKASTPTSTAAAEGAGLTRSQTPPAQRASQHISKDVLQVILDAAPSLLGAQVSRKASSIFGQRSLCWFKA